MNTQPPSTNVAAASTTAPAPSGDEGGDIEFVGSRVAGDASHTMAVAAGQVVSISDDSDSDDDSGDDSGDEVELLGEEKMRLHTHVQEHMKSRDARRRAQATLIAGYEAASNYYDGRHEWEVYSSAPQRKMDGVKLDDETYSRKIREWNRLQYRDKVRGNEVAASGGAASGGAASSGAARSRGTNGLRKCPNNCGHFSGSRAKACTRCKAPFSAAISPNTARVREYRKAKKSESNHKVKAWNKRALQYEMEALEVAHGGAGAKEKFVKKKVHSFKNCCICEEPMVEGDILGAQMLVQTCMKKNDTQVAKFSAGCGGKMHASCFRMYQGAVLKAFDASEQGRSPNALSTFKCVFCNGQSYFDQGRWAFDVGKRLVCCLTQQPGENDNEFTFRFEKHMSDKAAGKREDRKRKRDEAASAAGHDKKRLRSCALCGKQAGPRAKKCKDCEYVFPTALSAKSLSQKKWRQKRKDARKKKQVWERTREELQQEYLELSGKAYNANNIIN